MTDLYRHLSSVLDGVISATNFHSNIHHLPLPITLRIGPHDRRCDKCLLLAGTSSIVNFWIRLQAAFLTSGAIDPEL